MLTPGCVQKRATQTLADVLLFILITLNMYLHAGIFGPNIQQRCIDDPVKQDKAFWEK